ncbi:hypothetical protein SAMD00019534_022940 [Acytostelium subglobosum LB1]|uniref:hypothetical protein n=1 Tax=Acytostelium subglobosum LB1 TaxID=1410327 RepID=UPI000644BE77|nr:hypothetical protein SAMD00019534_022940 [Acytostelium subglobosum LB1]GAM19119.1 hypothetical protein SAMD00019534_022940 [Acytostelium subglobosum LB1]|eukprot:XP_012757046.1 hypothetical protein SAMD00019534_022940 [Acytostelium subglobosum LB1]
MTTRAVLYGDRVSQSPAQNTNMFNAHSLNRMLFGPRPNSEYAILANYSSLRFLNTFHEEHWRITLQFDHAPGPSPLCELELQQSSSGSFLCRMLSRHDLFPNLKRLVFRAIKHDCDEDLQQWFWAIRANTTINSFDISMSDADDTDTVEEMEDYLTIYHQKQHLETLSTSVEHVFVSQVLPLLKLPLLRELCIESTLFTDQDPETHLAGQLVDAIVAHPSIQRLKLDIYGYEFYQRHLTEKFGQPAIVSQDTQIGETVFEWKTTNDCTFSIVGCSRGSSLEFTKEPII